MNITQTFRPTRILLKKGEEFRDSTGVVIAGSLKMFTAPDDVIEFGDNGWIVICHKNNWFAVPPDQIQSIRLERLTVKQARSTILIDHLAKETGPLDLANQGPAITYKNQLVLSSPDTSATSDFNKPAPITPASAVQNPPRKATRALPKRYNETNESELKGIK